MQFQVGFLIVGDPHQSPPKACYYRNTEKESSKFKFSENLFIIIQPHQLEVRLFEVMFFIFKFFFV